MMSLKLSKVLLINILILMLFSHICSASATSYIDSRKISIISQPVNPVIIPEDTIKPGEYWTYRYDLIKNHRYHIYLNGEWTEDKKYETDYDVYVYYGQGSTYNFINGYTESAGYPEQIHNDEKCQYFIPDKSGYYYFTIYNDPKESNSSKEAILTIIENVDTNKWYNVYLEGKKDGKIQYSTNWAFEYNTTSTNTKIIIKVPNSLDMYEARLYLMSTPETSTKGTSLGQLVNGIPISWSNGLKGEIKSGVGGLNFEPQGYRDVYSSAQYYGEDMEISYLINNNKNKLFYLVLIGEEGDGNVDFLIQTNFDPPNINVYNESKIVCLRDNINLDFNIDSLFELNKVYINYTYDNITYYYQNFEETELDYYRCVLKNPKPGDVVYYKIEVLDELNQYAKLENSFKIMSQTGFVYTVSSNRIKGGEGVFVDGYTVNGNYDFQLIYQHKEDKIIKDISSDEDGKFSNFFIPNKLGTWSMYMIFDGNDKYFNASSEIEEFEVFMNESILTLNLDRDKYDLNEEIKLGGFFNYKQLGVEIIINIYYEGNVTHILSLTSSDGSYEAFFIPESKGEYSVISKVKGEEPLYGEAESSVVYFSVVKSFLPLPIRNVFRFLTSSNTIYFIIGLCPVVFGGLFIYRRYSNQETEG